jgi:hypothetical protein
LSKLKNIVLLIFFAYTFSDPCWASDAEQKKSGKSAIKLDFLTFWDAYQPLHQCVKAYSQDEKDFGKTLRFKKKLWASLDLNAVIIAAKSIIGNNHPVFTELSKEEWSESERSELLFQALALFSNAKSDPDSRKRLLQVKAMALISVQMATATDGRCVPTKKLLHLMEQVPHADN